MVKKIILGIIIFILAVVVVGAFLFANYAPKDEIVTASYSDGATVVDASFNNTEGTVTFEHPSTGKITLPRAISASGARYADENEEIVFWEHQDELTITKNNITLFKGQVQHPESESKIPSELLNTWIWENTLMSDDSVITPEQLGMFTITFNSDGSISGTTDCNDFGGSFTADAQGNISFGQFVMTEMFCQFSQESVFVNELSNVDKYLFDDSGNLVLNLKVDSGGMHFIKQQ